MRDQHEAKESAWTDWAKALFPAGVPDELVEALESMVKQNDSAPPDVPADTPDALRGEFMKLRFQAVLDVWKASRAATKDDAKGVQPELPKYDSRVPTLPKHVPALGLQDLVKQYYTSVVDEWRAKWRDDVQELIDDRKRNEQLEDTDIKAESELEKSIHDAYIEVAKTSLDRAIQRATFVTTVVSAISGAYTALLALVFSTGGRQLPVRGVVPVVFLGIALVLSAFYMAFLRGHQKERVLLPSGLGGEVEQKRLATFMEWTFSGVLARSWALRLSVVCLGLGVIFLPLPFLNIGTFGTAVGFGVAVAVFVLWAAGELIVWGLDRRKPYAPEAVPGPPGMALVRPRQ